MTLRGAIAHRLTTYIIILTSRIFEMWCKIVVVHPSQNVLSSSSIVSSFLGMKWHGWPLSIWRIITIYAHIPLSNLSIAYNHIYFSKTNLCIDHFSQNSGSGITDQRLKWQGTKKNLKYQFQILKPWFQILSVLWEKLSWWWNPSCHLLYETSRCAVHEKLSNITNFNTLNHTETFLWSCLTVETRNFSQ